MFQKRGLPHQHLLLAVRTEDKPKTTEDIDERVRAELPDSTCKTTRALSDVLRRCMVHGPCGRRNPYAPCMREDGTCKAKFSKDFTANTLFVEDSYPRYRR